MLNQLPIKTHVKRGPEVPLQGPQRSTPDEQKSGGFESAVQAAMQEEEQFAQSAKPEPLAEQEEAATQLAERETHSSVEGENGTEAAFSGESTPSGILLAESGLQGSEAIPKDGEQAFRQLMPLLGGDHTVDPTLSRFHGAAAGTVAEPLMTQPLQDAMSRVGQAARPAPLDPLSGVAVQELLDSEAIAAKDGLRKQALSVPTILHSDGLQKGGNWENGGVANAVATPLDQGLRQLMAEPKVGDGIASEGPLKTLGQVGSTQAALEQSAPWLGVEPERNFVAEPPLVPGERLLASPIPLAPIEHALLTADIRDASAPQLTESAKLMAGNAPRVSPEQAAPWARSLLEAVSPPGVQVSDDATTPVQDTLESSEGIENGGDEMSRPESSLKSGVASSEVGRSGFRSTLTSTVANPATVESTVTGQAPVAESDGPRPTQSLKASIQAQTMTPQMAMASDDVAEFTVVKPDQMEVRIQDLEGELELSVAREEDGLSVKVRAPKEIIEDFQDMRGDVETALSEDGEELSSFDAEANDTSAEGSSLGSEDDSKESEETNTPSPSIEGLGARVLSRLV